MSTIAKVKNDIEVGNQYMGEAVAHTSAVSEAAGGLSVLHSVKQLEEIAGILETQATAAENAPLGVAADRREEARKVYMNSLDGARDHHLIFGSDGLVASMNAMGESLEQAGGTRMTYVEKVREAGRLASLAAALLVEHGEPNAVALKEASDAATQQGNATIESAEKYSAVL